MIWIRFDELTLDLGPFYWFGSELGRPLPDLCHTRANRTGKKNFRPNHRELGKQRFARLETIGDVATALFGA